MKHKYGRGKANQNKPRIGMIVVNSWLLTHRESTHRYIDVVYNTYVYALTYTCMHMCGSKHAYVS